MSKELQEDVIKSGDVDIQNGDGSRQRLFDEANNEQPSAGFDAERMRSDTASSVLPGMEITNAVEHPVDPYTSPQQGKGELTEQEYNRMKDAIKRVKDPAQEWVEAEKKMYEDARLRERLQDGARHHNGDFPDKPNYDPRENANEISNLLSEQKDASFGDAETRDRIKSILEDAFRNGNLDEVLDNIEFGDDIDTSNPNYQQAIKFDFDPESNEVKMVMHFWPVKMGPREVDSIKLFS